MNTANTEHKLKKYLKYLNITRMYEEKTIDLIPT